jgi:type II secretory pathway component PulL
VEFPPETLSEQATVIHEALFASGWRGSPLVIGLAASFCLAAAVDVPAPAMLRKRQAMRFHLEGWIPWSAEEFVADLVPHHSAALMVAVRVEPLRGLLEELEQRDVAPVAIVPLAFLVLGQHLVQRDVAPNHALLWRHGEELDAFVVRDGKPFAWRHARASSIRDLTQFCSLDSLEQGVDAVWTARGLNDQELSWLRVAGIGVQAADDLAWEDSLRESVAAIAAEQLEPLIDLRRDELAGARPVQALGPQLRRLQVAALLAVLTVCGTLWMRGDQYAEQTIVLRQQLTEVFEEAFPKEPPPERILAAMRKAHTLLRGTRGPVKELPVGPSSDLVLQQVLAVLPNDLRYRVPEIRIEGSGIYLGGEVRSNADADQIAAALRAAGFEVDSPRTQRLAEQGFAVRLAGQATSSDNEATVK